MEGELTNAGECGEPPAVLNEGVEGVVARMDSTSNKEEAVETERVGDETERGDMALGDMGRVGESRSLAKLSEKAIEIGLRFKLGTKFSPSFGDLVASSR